MPQNTNGQPVLNNAERAKGGLVPLLVVPPDVFVDYLNEPLGRDAPAGPRIEQLIL